MKENTTPIEYMGKKFVRTLMILSMAGLLFSGYHQRDDGTRLMEFLELPKTKHPFFIATQSHPCFKSTLLDPAPLYVGFVAAALERQNSFHINANSLTHIPKAVSLQ